MKAALLEPVDVRDLRLGMFVHLDIGWMSHPFPLSSFKLDTPQQIEIIRGLGLKQVRWAPEQSDPPRDDEGVAPKPPEGVTPPAAAASPTPVESPEVRARIERRRRAAAQREALQRCERQYGEAARDFQRTWDQVLGKPEQARQHAEQLSRALVDKMLGEQEMCVRLLSEQSGDRSAMHALNVMLISLLMGRSFGLDENDLLDLGVGAMLHDVGKIELPERVRHRDEHMTPSEASYYEEHVARGVAQARRMGLSAGASLVIAQHHEHADGTGFPLKIGAERMSPMSRIVALVNRYDRLCNPPLGVRAHTPHEALSYMFAQGKSRFDTAILGAFIKMMGVYPPGSTVQLTDDRYAIVVAVNASRPLKPRVLVHEAGVPAAEAMVLDLESQSNLGIRRSMAPLQLPDAAMRYLAPRQRVAYFFEPALVFESTM
jgi:putative nucleotidyltransferase with HDIG domain